MTPCYTTSCNRDSRRACRSAKDGVSPFAASGRRCDALFWCGLDHYTFFTRNDLECRVIPQRVDERSRIVRVHRCGESPPEESRISRNLNRERVVSVEFSRDLAERRVVEPKLVTAPGRGVTGFDSGSRRQRASVGQAYLFSGHHPEPRGPLSILRRPGARSAGGSLAPR